jgi:hypothetical protein
VLDTIHEFIYSTRGLWGIIALAGIGYAVYIYVRVISTLSASEQRPRRHSPLKAPAAPATDVKTEPMAPAIEDDDEPAQQEDLLSQLPDDSPGALPPTKPIAKAAEPAAKADDEEDDDEPGPVTKHFGERHDGDSDYGIDQKARTRFDLGRPSEERKRTPLNVGQIETRVMDAVPDEPPAESIHQASVTRRDRRTSEGKLVSLSPEAPQEPRADDGDTQVQAEPSRRVSEPVDDQELLRRATRMEELGFHVGITPDRLRKEPTGVSEAEKEDLLRTLGLVERQAEEQGLVDTEGTGLNDILAKLDAALGEAFKDEPDSDAPLEEAVAERRRTGATEAEAESDDEAEIPTDDSEPATDQQAATTLISSVETKPDDKTRWLDALAKADGVAEEEVVDKEPVKEETAEKESAQPELSVTAADEPEAGETASSDEVVTEEAPAEEPKGETPQEAGDDQADLPSEPEAAATVDTAPSAPEPSGEAPPPPASTRRTPRADSSVPAWARADTFDEDFGDEDGKADSTPKKKGGPDDDDSPTQLNLFG